MALPILVPWGINKQESVENILKSYTRDVTVLEIGEFPKDSICQLAESYPESVFILMGKDQEEFAEKLQEKNCKNLIWLNHFPTCEDIQTLSLSEHFDLIILNHFDRMPRVEWEKMARLCQSMSHHVVVPEDGQESLVVLENHLPFSLIKRSCIHPRTITRLFTVYFDYDRIFLDKIRPPYPDRRTSWQPGINLITFLVFNGYYPDRFSIILNLPLDFEHRDWMPNNMILQVATIILIDKDDPTNLPGGTSGWRLCQDEIMHTIRLVGESLDKSPEAVKQLFGKIYNVEEFIQCEEAD